MSPPSERWEVMRRPTRSITAKLVRHAPPSAWEIYSHRTNLVFTPNFDYTVCTSLTAPEPRSTFASSSPLKGSRIIGIVGMNRLGRSETIM